MVAKTENKYYKIEIVLITALIVLGVVNKIFAMIAFILASLFIFFNKNIDNVYLLFAIAPLAGIFKLGSESDSFFTYIQMIFVIKSFVKLNDIKPSLVLLVLLFVCYTLLETIVFKIDISHSLIYIIKLGIICLTAYSVVNMIENKRQFCNLAIIFLCGMLVGSVLGLFRSTWPALHNIIGSAVSQGELIRFSGIVTDPNFYSINVILISSIIAILFVKKEISVVYFVLSVILFFFGFLTYSKSFFIMAILFAIMLLLLLIANKRWGILFACLSLGVMCILVLIATGYLDAIIVRFNTDEGISGVTTGRVDIWKYYIDEFRVEPLKMIFGFGLSTPMPHGRASHNFILQIVYRLGIVGGVFFVALLCLSMSKTLMIKNRNNMLVKTMPLVLWGMMTMFLDMLFAYELVFQILLIRLFFQYDFGCKNSV